MSFSKWPSIVSTSSSFENQMQQRFTKSCFSLAQKIDGTKEMALCFRIIAQYMVKTKFNDALKILVAREKMAN